MNKGFLEGGTLQIPQDCVLTEGALDTDTCGERHMRRKVWMAMMDHRHQERGWEALAGPSQPHGTDPATPRPWTPSLQTEAVGFCCYSCP